MAPVDAQRTSRAGRNLPAAIAVGVGLLALLAASLWFRPEPFVALVVVAQSAALWELRARSRAVTSTSR